MDPVTDLRGLQRSLPSINPVLIPLDYSTKYCSQEPIIKPHSVPSENQTNDQTHVIFEINSKNQQAFPGPFQFTFQVEI